MWLGMSVVDTVVSSPRKEAAAFDAAVATAAETYAHNPLITAVLAEAKKPGGPQRAGLSGALPEDLLNRLKRVAEVLDKQTTASEATEFKEFLIAFAEQVAHASGESAVGSSMTVSQPERRFIRQAKKLFGI